MDDFQRMLEKSLKDPEFRKLWEEDELEHQIISMLIRLRAENHLSQKDLSELTGIRQSNISRIETGKARPDLATLERIAQATGKKLELRFV